MREMEDSVCEARAKGIPEAEIAEAERLIEQIRQSWGSIEKLLQEPSPEEVKLNAFAEKLAARQGTTMSDFDALYKKKADIDRRIGKSP